MAKPELDSSDEHIPQPQQLRQQAVHRPHSRGGSCRFDRRRQQQQQLHQQQVPRQAGGGLETECQKTMDAALEEAMQESHKCFSDALANFSGFVATFGLDAAPNPKQNLEAPPSP